MSLNEQQLKALINFKMNKNILVTGPAGTGKSYLINQILETGKILNKNVAITAMTGCAAWNIKGKTLHSWAGIGTGEKNTESLLKNIIKNKKIKENWQKTDTLIIDEVSMLTKNLFEKINDIAQRIRNNPRSFGGIQIILLGDFYQLPPIDNGNDKVSFCFESSIWGNCINTIVHLTEIIRQTDPILQKCLNEIRIGDCSDETEQILKTCLDKKYSTEKDSIIPTKIYSIKSKIKDINERELKALETDIIKYDIKTKKEIKNKGKKIYNESIDYYSENIDKFANYEKELKLAIGAQVMLLVNLNVEEGLVNGSRGIITRFDGKFPVVKFLDGNEQIISDYNWEFDEKDFKIIKTQIPLQLAWAVTIHKIQGSTLNYAIVDVGNSIFEYGQSYVALSRVKTLEGLYLVSFTKKKIKAHPKVIEFYQNLESSLDKKQKKNIFDHFTT